MQCVSINKPITHVVQINFDRDMMAAKGMITIARKIAVTKIGVVTTPTLRISQLFLAILTYTAMRFTEILQ